MRVQVGSGEVGTPGCATGQGVALKGWDWGRVSWIANTYEGWERLWTAAGGVAMGIGSIIVSEFSPQMHSKIMKAAERCAQTAKRRASTGGTKEEGATRRRRRH